MVDDKVFFFVFWGGENMGFGVLWCKCLDLK